MDCFQDSLLRNQDQKKQVKANKTSFNLKNLLKEISEIFQVSLTFRGNQNIQQSISNNNLNQRHSICYYQGKPQRDQNFSRQRINSEVILDSSDTLPNTQQPKNQNLESQTLKISKEIPCPQTITIPNIKFDETQLNGNSTHVQTDQFIINNDVSRLKQILIALVTNMICLNKASNDKKYPISERVPSDAIEYNQIELICTEETNQLFDYYHIKFRLYCSNSSSLPHNDDLLKYLNGQSDPEINKLCQKLINNNLQIVGPHKLKSELIGKDQIEISFDIFKNLDIMESRDKGCSLNSHSQMTSHNNIAITPPLGSTTPPFGITSPPLGAVTPPQGATKSFIHSHNYLTASFTSLNYLRQHSKQFLTVKSVNKNNKYLSVQSQLNNNSNNIFRKTQQQQNNQIDQISNLNDFPSFTSRQCGESEMYATQNCEQVYNSNILFKFEQPVKVQQQTNNSISNINSLRNSQQVISNYPPEDSDSDKYREVQNNQQSELDIQIKTLQKQEVSNFGKRDMQNKDIQNENYKKGNILQMKLINDIANDLKIHTIQSINQQLN